MDASTAIVSGRNVLEVRAAHCCCATRFGVRLVERRSNAYLGAEVRRRCMARDDSALEAARARVVASFVAARRAAAVDDDALHETAVHSSLRDPLTLRRLVNPVRGAACRHAQPFDLLSYIAFQRTDIRFRCPVSILCVCVCVYACCVI
jgi:hypothetical protein